jgi:hypothetical protein
MLERSTFLENMVEGELADFRSHRGLGELGDGIFGILDSVA